MVSTSNTVAQPAADQSERVAFGKLAWVAPLTALVASIGNLIIYALARAGGALPDSVVMPMNGQPLPAAAVVLSTVAGVAGATAVYALLGRFTRRPITIFRIVAAIVLVLSLASPFGIAGAGGAYVAVLLAMHFVTAVVAVGLLTTRARRA